MDNVRYELFGKIINNININILEHGYFIGDENWRYYGVCSPFNRIYFMVAGEGRVETQNETVILEPGKMYIIPPNIKFNLICDNYIEKLYMHFSTGLFSGNDVFDGVGRCIYAEIDESWLKELISCTKSSSFADIFKCKAMLFEAVSVFLKQLSLNVGTTFAINCKYRHIYKYINENLSAALTSKKVAEALNLSYSSLIKKYKKDTGITLNSYIRNALLKKGIEKLLFTDASIKEIAFDLKFTDEFYFSRFFKKQTGLSPREYKTVNKFKV